MKKTTKKTTKPAATKEAPPWQPTEEEVNRAASGLMRLIEQAQHRNELATIVELADRIAELEEVNDGLRHQIRTLGGVIAST
jgi:uncharacterized protein Yka (UPF0111/DUF47 family)